MLTAIKNKLFELYIYAFGRDTLNRWVLTNYNTIPEDVIEFANKWVSSHTNELVRRYESKSILEIPAYWPDRWRDELYKYLKRNGLHLNHNQRIADLEYKFYDGPDEEQDNTTVTVVYWLRDDPTTRLNGTGLFWHELLECHARHVDNEKFAGKIFAEEIKPKLAIGEVVFVSSPVWALYGQHIGSMLYGLRARIIYNAARECYAISLPHKARWEDAQLYDNPVDPSEWEHIDNGDESDDESDTVE